MPFVGRKGDFIDRIFRGAGSVIAANAIEVASGLAEQAAGRIHPTLPAVVRAEMLRRRQKLAGKPPAEPNPPEAPPRDEADEAAPYIEMRQRPDGCWEAPPRRTV